MSLPITAEDLPFYKQDAKQKITLGIKRIKELGWDQGANFVPGGSACMVLSIPYAAGLVERMIMSALRLTAKTDFVIEWNDTPGRTVEEILDVMEEAKDVIDKFTLEDINAQARTSS